MKKTLIALGLTGALLLTACGDDDAATTTQATTTTAGVPAGAEVLVSELVASGLTQDQATCAVLEAIDMYGLDAMLGTGDASDDELIELAGIIEGCMA